MTVPLLRSQAAILVVDDDPDILDLVEILVSEAGLQPHCHADGDSALAALDRDVDRILEKRRWLLRRGLVP